MKIKIAITQGDINGIGYQVILKALEDNRILELCTPVIYGSARIAAQYRKLLGMPDFRLNIIDAPAAARPAAVPSRHVSPAPGPAHPRPATPPGAPPPRARRRQRADRHANGHAGGGRRRGDA